ncbi:hypothetical protein SAMN02910358_02246 [Lachnospiraceae bacterium XBB1006]|nr:hypothetical protein SAMN02910358_02246 [Lachnospiraceae bacterium XBB1006]
MKIKRVLMEHKVLVSAIIVLMIGILVAIMPTRVSVSREKVTKIEIRSGYTGQCVEITSPEKIDKIIDNLNGAKVKKAGWSLFRLGYGYRITFYSGNSELGGRWGSFIVNDTDLIRNDPFFYVLEKEKIDTSFFERILNNPWEG